MDDEDVDDLSVVNVCDGVVVTTMPNWVGLRRDKHKPLVRRENIMLILCEKQSCIITRHDGDTEPLSRYNVMYDNYRIGKIIQHGDSGEWCLLITHKDVIMSRGYVNKLWDNFDRVSKATCPIKYWMRYGKRKD